MNANPPPLLWTAEKIKQVANALKIVRDHNFRNRGQLLPREIFFAWLQTFYGIAIEMAVTWKEEVFLVQRDKKDSFFAGLWHIPGGILFPKESALKAPMRVLEDEFGLDIMPKRVRFLGLFDNPEQHLRGHEPQLLFHLRLKSNEKKKLTKVKQGRWFDIKQPPKKLVGYQHPLLKVVAKNLSV